MIYESDGMKATEWPWKPIDCDEWSEDKFKLELKKTNWYQTRSASQQEWDTLENDPARKAEYDSRIAEAKSALKASADSMGATISDADLTKLARESLRNDWKDSQVRSAVSAYVGYTTDPTTGIKSLFGEAGTNEDDLRTYAEKMGVSVTDDWVLQNVKNAASTGAGIDASKDWIRSRSKEKYGIWANDLNDPNTTVDDLSYNYRTTMANMLEIGIDEVDMNNPMIQQIMMNGDGSGNKATLFDFQKQLRLDPRWAKTKTAQEQSTNVVNSVLVIKHRLVELALDLFTRLFLRCLALNCIDELLQFHRVVHHSLELLIRDQSDVFKTVDFAKVPKGVVCIFAHPANAHFVPLHFHFFQTFGKFILNEGSVRILM